MRTSTWPFWFLILARSSVVFISCCSKEWFFLNPYWHDGRILLSLKCFITLLDIICSVILQGTDVRETGRQFAGSVLSSFLNMGITFPINQSAGTFPVLMDLLYNISKYGVMESAASFNTLLLTRVDVFQLLYDTRFCHIYGFHIYSSWFRQFGQSEFFICIISNVDVLIEVYICKRLIRTVG